MRLSRVAALCLATVGVAVAVTVTASAQTAEQVDQTNATVVNVVDGDTVVVIPDAAGAGGEVVRLLGVDAPERDECDSAAATDYLERRLLGARVRLDAGQQTHDRYGRLLAGVFVNGALVETDLAVHGLGRPMLVTPGDRFRAQIAAVWTGPATRTSSCDVEADQQRQPTAATALQQNAGLGLDEQVRQSGQVAWLAYEAARTADLTDAVDALVPADTSELSTAEDLLADPATASVADFDDAATTIKQQVNAVQSRNESLADTAARLLWALREPSTQGGTDLNDERWTAIPPSARADIEQRIQKLTKHSEEALREARSIWKQYRELAAKAKARADAKARAAEALAHPISVGTYNICKSTCGTGQYSWDGRRKALVNEVRWADPDVLAIQEANTATWHGTRQIDDVRQLLRSAGYEIASTDYTCTKGCTRGAHIFYQPTRMSPSTLPNKHMTAAGMTSLATIAHTKFGHIQDRAVSWAFLTPNGSTRPTLYVSVHMVTDKSELGETLRVATAQRMKGFTTKLVARAGLKDDVPIVVAGDFNSYHRRQPHGAQTIMTSSGFHDGYTAPVKINAHIGTVNYTPKIAKYDGFPLRPPRYQGTPTRIDYVFSTVAPLRHEVVVRLTKSGRFDDRYRASDHNMVIVDLPVR